jgi:hypothetical protein
MSRHTLTTEVDYRFPTGNGEQESCQPTLAITYDYSPGYPGRGPDLHQPGEPPEPAELSFVSATVIDHDQNHVPDEKARELAQEYLDSDAGYREAVAHAEETSGPDPDYLYDSQRDDALDKMERWHDHADYD